MGSGSLVASNLRIHLDSDDLCIWYFLHTYAELFLFLYIVSVW